MSGFSPIDPSLYAKTPTSISDPPFRRIGQRSIFYLKVMDAIDQPDRFANSWGYTIFRTDYSSPGADQKFAQAVKMLNTYAGNWLFSDLRTFPGTPPLDPRTMYEVRSRLLNVTVENRPALESATIEEVGRHFDNWIEQHGEDIEFCDNPRFQFCIMLDKESVENVLSLPEDPDLVQLPENHFVWVKVLTTKVRDGQRLWLRIGVYDVIWVHWFMITETEVSFEEMVGEFDDEEGVINLYGPPTPEERRFQLDLSKPLPTLMDTTHGHPPRQLADIVYPRIKQWE